MIGQATKTDKGVTLLELMIVLVISAVLVGGIYTLFTTQQRSYFVQDQVAGIQQDARAALTIMARDIRMAGMVIGAGNGGGFSDGSTDFTLVLPSGNYNFAITPQNNTTTPDQLTVVLSVQELGEVLAVNGDVVTLDDGVSYFNSNPLYVAFDLKAGRVYQVTGFDTGTQTMAVTNAPSELLIVGGKAYGVNAITYSVTTADGVLRQNTTGANDPLVGDGVTTFVEDLQFAYQVEGVNYWTFDGIVDASNGETDDTVLPAGMTNADIKMVRINITVRTAVEDAAVADAGPAAQFDQPPLEDHNNPADLNTDDGFRRRVYTTVVKARNL